MKLSFVTALILAASTAFSSGLQLSGRYVLALQELSFRAIVDINADGTYHYAQTQVDADPSGKGAVGCDGVYSVENNTVFSGTLDCSKLGGPKGITQKIDLAKVDMSALNSGKAVKVVVTSSLMEQPLPMTMVKVK